MAAFEKNRSPLRILFVGLLFAGIFENRIVADNKEKNHSPAKFAAAESDSSASELIGGGPLIVDHDEQSGDSPARIAVAGGKPATKVGMALWWLRRFGSSFGFQPPFESSIPESRHDTAGK